MVISSNSYETFIVKYFTFSIGDFWIRFFIYLYKRRTNKLGSCGSFKILKYSSYFFPFVCSTLYFNGHKVVQTSCIYLIILFYILVNNQIKEQMLPVQAHGLTTSCFNSNTGSPLGEGEPP